MDNEYLVMKLLLGFLFMLVWFFGLGVGYLVWG